MADDKKKEFQPIFNVDSATDQMLDRILDGIDTAKVRGKGKYDLAGTYLIRVDSVMLGQNWKFNTVLKIRKTIVHVFNNNNGTGSSVGDNTEQTVQRSWNNFHETFKTFVWKTLDLPEGELTKDLIKAVIDKDQPLRGMVIKVENYPGKPREGQEQGFMNVDYLKRIYHEELAGICDAKEMEKFFPADTLESMKAVEALFGRK